MGVRGGPQPPWQHSLPLYPNQDPDLATPNLPGAPGDTSHFIDVAAEARSPDPRVHCTYLVLVLESKVKYKHVRFIKITLTVSFFLSLFYPENKHKQFQFGKGLKGWPGGRLTDTKPKAPAPGGCGPGPLQPHPTASRGRHLPKQTGAFSHSFIQILAATWVLPWALEIQSPFNCRPQKGTSKKQTQVPLISRSSSLQISYHGRHKVQNNRWQRRGERGEGWESDRTVTLATDWALPWLLWEWLAWHTWLAGSAGSQVQLCLIREQLSRPLPYRKRLKRTKTR